VESRARFSFGGYWVFSWLGPALLLLSALLTAGYLLPITINGFFVEKSFDHDKLEKREPKVTMLIPVVILTAAVVLLGIFSGVFTRIFDRIA